MEKKSHLQDISQGSHVTRVDTLVNLLSSLFQHPQDNLMVCLLFSNMMGCWEVCREIRKFFNSPIIKFLDISLFCC